VAVDMIYNAHTHYHHTHHHYMSLSSSSNTHHYHLFILSSPSLYNIGLSIDDSMNSRLSRNQFLNRLPKTIIHKGDLDVVECRINKRC